MKEIKAIIRPFLLSKVIEALKGIPGLPGLTVDQHVLGFGKSRAKDAQDKITHDLIEYARKAKIELVVSDSMVDVVVQTIQLNAHTGNTGDGKIIVIDVEDVIKIRTNERGEKAI